MSEQAPRAERPPLGSRLLSWAKSLLAAALPPQDPLMAEQAKHLGYDWEVDCRRWHGQVLTGQFSHWCPDWDFLPIDETCGEMDGCVCGFVPASGSVWQHLKTGHHYRVTGWVLREADLVPCVTYLRWHGEGAEHGPIWARPVDEFLDGRFKEVREK